MFFSYRHKRFHETLRVPSSKKRNTTRSQPSRNAQVTAASRKHREFPLKGELHQPVEYAYTQYESAPGNSDSLYHEVLDDGCQGDNQAMLQQGGSYDVARNTNTSATVVQAYEFE